jgi:SAM-dependent methyltransferase
MSITSDTPDLKARHRAMWALGDYARVADELVPDVGQAVTDACRIRQGERVLDVAAGTGNAAIPAALAGARVTACDLTPELLVLGERRATEAGITDITWERADAEALPYDDGAFDVVESAIGVMFAPFHRAAASELLRVTRSGGRLGIASWTPAGFIGQMFATMKPFAPPPAGAQPPPLWGDEAHVRELLGDDVVGLSAEKRVVLVDAFATGAEFRDYFKACYGPTIVAYRGLGDDRGRIAALDAALADLGDGHLDEGRMTWEYLVVTAERR